MFAIALFCAKKSKPCACLYGSLTINLCIKSGLFTIVVIPSSSTGVGAVY